MSKFKEGQVLICKDDGVNDLKKGQLCTVGRLDGSNYVFIKEGNTRRYPNSYFTEATNLTKKQAIQAMLDGQKVRWSDWKGRSALPKYLYFDGMTFRKDSGIENRMNEHTNTADCWEIYTEDYTITLADGKKIELSEESYNSLKGV